MTIYAKMNGVTGAFYIRICFVQMNKDANVEVGPATFISL